MGVIGPRDIVKAVANAAAAAIVAPSVLSYRIRARLLDPDRAVTGSTQMWALVPGLLGQYLRRAFLRRALAECGADAVVEFGTIFSAARTRIEDRAYIGPRCHIGLAHIGRDALIAAAVHIPSGAHTHGSVSLRVPMREQTGDKRCVRIGSGAWIGSAAVVMADVGRDSIVGAGSVVTRALPDRVIAGGVPARILRTRDHASVVSA